MTSIFCNRDKKCAILPAFQISIRDVLLVIHSLKNDVKPAYEI